MPSFGDAKYGYYQYDPSTAAAAVFAILYLIETILVIYQIFRHRAWVWTVFLVASVMELIGYVSRIVSIKNDTRQRTYVTSFAVIVLAPVLMAAALYLVFGRIISHVLPKNLRTIRLIWVPPRFVTLIFVGCDIVAFLLQAWGAIDVASASVGDKSQLQTGKKIVLIGLGVQLACFGYFALVSLRAQWALRRFRGLIHQNQRVKMIDGGKKYEIMVGGRKKKTRSYNANWYLTLTAVNGGSLLILVRSIYRVVEFALGKSGYVQVHEWTFYVFDTLPIFVAFILFNFFHPGRFLSNMRFSSKKCDIWAGQDDVNSTMPMSEQGGQMSGTMAGAPSAAYSDGHEFAA